jgi:hypothetical protein
MFDKCGSAVLYYFLRCAGMIGLPRADIRTEGGEVIADI